MNMKEGRVALAIGLALAGTAVAQASEHAAVFARYLQVVNAGDGAGLRALIADDVERSSYPGCTPAMNNKDCLVFYIESTVLKNHGKLTRTESYGLDGDTLYCGTALRSDAVKAAGSERIVGIDKIKVKNGKIAGLWFLPNIGDPQTKRYFERVLADAPPEVRARVLDQ